MNLRPSGYEPDELPGCSTPRCREPGARSREPGGRLERGGWPVGAWTRVSGSGFRSQDPGPRTNSSWVLAPGSCPLILLRGPGGDLLSRVLRRSTIGAEGFHGRVRDGIGWGTLAMTTRPSRQDSGIRSQVPGARKADGAVAPTFCPGSWVLVPVSWCVPANGDRGWSPRRAIERLGPVSCTHCCASTSGLSTCWSCTALRRDLVLRGVSRLDAFSGYLVRTWLPGCAAGATTGPPEVRPPRSSRTRGSASQVSYTHGR